MKQIFENGGFEMGIKVIAACDVEYGIGYKNELLFRIKKDLQRFRQLTEDQIVVMGRKTFETLPAPLVNRKNVILTRNERYEAPNNVIVEHSFERILNHYLDTGEQDKDLWVIGGSEIYKLFLPFADEVYLTMVLEKAERADTYFPCETLDDFKVTNIEKHYCDESDLGYLFVDYEREDGGMFDGENNYH